MLMFVCSSIIFAYFMKIAHEHQRVEINIAKTKAKYNALSGFALEAYENMFFRDFITDTLANGEPADSVQFYVGGSVEETGIIEEMGNYDSVSVRIRKKEGQLVRYGYAQGMANYSTTFGKTLTLTDSVDITTKYLPSLNTFMYLTGDERAGGAPQIHDNTNTHTRSEVKFGENDKFSGGDNGKFQSNGTIVTSGCPTFSSTVTLTRNCDGTVNEPDITSCNSNIFDGEPPLDTSATVCLPPPSFDQKKQFDDFTFDATELQVSDGNAYPGGIQRDTLIMTELEFYSSGGFRVTRYKYLMPPHLRMDLTSSQTPQNPTGAHLETSGLGAGFCNGLMEIDACNQYEQALNRYHARTIENEDEVSIDSDVRGPHGMHHFDTHLFQFDPGRNSEFEPDGISVNSTEHTSASYFPSEPSAIYIKGGPVLVHGTFKGRYTIITDEYMTYRRHAYPVNNAIDTPIDTVYCNIWLVNDLINADVVGQGGEQHAELNEFQPTDKCEGGSENLMGLVSGANVIIANTRANGARDDNAPGGNANINIHAHIIAFNESFVMQYWQTNSQFKNDWNVLDGTYGEPRTTKADGNGDRYTPGNANDDSRGYVYLWGGIVQSYRGYMRRNCSGPYCNNGNFPGNIGMNKDYNWDDNHRCNALPLYPERIDCNDDCGESSGPPQYDFEIAQFRIF